MKTKGNKRHVKRILDFKNRCQYPTVYEYIGRDSKRALRKARKKKILRNDSLYEENLKRSGFDAKAV